MREITNLTKRDVYIHLGTTQTVTRQKARIVDGDKVAYVEEQLAVTVPGETMEVPASLDRRKPTKIRCTEDQWAQVEAVEASVALFADGGDLSVVKVTR